MKSSQILSICLMTSLKELFLPLRPRQKTRTKAACVLIASFACASAHAGTIGFAFSNFSGTETGPPVQSGTTLLVDNAANGSFITYSPVLNSVWNPVAFTDHCIIDLTTGFLTGTVDFVFSDGSTLFGTEAEDVRALVATNGVGPFTGTFTFTGGTGELAGAIGSISFSGVGTSIGFSESGNGTLIAAGVTTPEPASDALIFGGLLAMVGSRKLFRRRRKRL